jgi:threonine dehydratase
MVDFSDIHRAMEQLKGRVNRTDVTTDSKLSQQVGVEVCYKWESHQLTGAFKVRGALNTILNLPKEKREAGVVASSSGNHAIGITYSARQTGIPAFVFVPEYTSQKKITALSELGAKIQIVDGGYSIAEEKAIKHAEEIGAVFISPYNHPDVIAGQGTIGIEWLEQSPNLDTVLIPIAGGGLGSGIGLAMKGIKPTVHLIGISTEGSAFQYENWHGRDMESVEIHPNLADGLTGKIDPHAITVPLICRLFDDFLLVNDKEIASAVAYLFSEQGEIVEGAAAVGLAALLTGKVENLGRSVGVLITSGNIHPDQHRNILDRAEK